MGSKIKGLYTDHLKRDTYSFTLACNYQHGAVKTTLWCEAIVRTPGLLQLCLERGVYQGEKIMIASTEVTQNAAIYGGKPMAFMQAVVTHLVFLTEVRPDAIINTSTGTPRIIQYAEITRKTG